MKEGNGRKRGRKREMKEKREREIVKRERGKRGIKIR